MIKYSKPAREQMVQRGISTNEVEKGIKKGSKELQKPDKILCHFRHFIVVTRKLDGDYFIITVKPRW